MREGKGGGEGRGEEERKRVYDVQVMVGWLPSSSSYMRTKLFLTLSSVILPKYCSNTCTILFSTCQWRSHDGHMTQSRGHVIIPPQIQEQH